MFLGEGGLLYCEDWQYWQRVRTTQKPLFLGLGLSVVHIPCCQSISNIWFVKLIITAIDLLCLKKNYNIARRERKKGITVGNLDPRFYGISILFPKSQCHFLYLIFIFYSFSFFISSMAYELVVELLTKPQQCWTLCCGWLRNGSKIRRLKENGEGAAKEKLWGGRARLLSVIEETAPGSLLTAALCHTQDSCSWWLEGGATLRSTAWRGDHSRLRPITHFLHFSFHGPNRMGILKYQCHVFPIFLLHALPGHLVSLCHCHCHCVLQLDVKVRIKEFYRFGFVGLCSVDFCGHISSSSSVITHTLKASEAIMWIQNLFFCGYNAKISKWSIIM